MRHKRKERRVHKVEMGGDWPFVEDSARLHLHDSVTAYVEVDGESTQLSETLAGIYWSAHVDYEDAITEVRELRESDERARDQAEREELLMITDKYTLKDGIIRRKNGKSSYGIVLADALDRLFESMGVE